MARPPPFAEQNPKPSVRDALLQYWKIVEARPWHLAFPFFLAILIAITDSGSLALLIPLSEGVAENSFQTLRDSGAFAWLWSLIPQNTSVRKDPEVLLALVLIALILLGRMLKLGFEYGRKVYLDHRNERYRAKAREETFARVLTFGRQYFDRQALGRIDTEVGWSRSVVEVLWAMEGLFLHLFQVVLKTGLLLAMSIPLTATLALAYGIIQLALGRLNKRIVSFATEETEVERRMRQETVDLLATIPLVKAFSQEREASDSHAAIVQESRGLALNKRRLQHLRYPIEEAVILLSMLAVQGIILWTQPGFQPGELVRFVAFLLVAQQAFPDFLGIGINRFRIMEQIPVLQSLATLLSDTGKHVVTSGSREFPGLQQEIRIHGLSFHYEGGPQVLKNIELTIPAGKMTAIVGGSGAGKTTLVDLLARFYDCSPGSIYLDGVDIREYSLPSLHRELAIVSQDVWLLNRSLRDNLTFGLPTDPSDEELISLLKELELGAFLDSLSQGLESPVGDRGVQLSGGQKQRIALARALLRDPSVLLLDEATSALDSIVEAQVEQTLKGRAQGKTLLVIAHRLSTIRQADTILVMEGGRVVEKGSWDALIAAGGAFADLHSAQFDQDEKDDKPAGVG